MEIQIKNKKNRPTFPTGYNKKVKKKIPKNYIKTDKKIVKAEFKFGLFIVSF
jgi:hypothetical protein